MAKNPNELVKRWTRADVQNVDGTQDKNPKDIAEEIEYFKTPGRIDYLDVNKVYSPNELYDSIHDGMDSDWDLFAYDGDTVHLNHKKTNNGYYWDRASGKIYPKSHDDYLNERKNLRAKSYLDDYYNNKFDLETLHTNLWKTFGDLKTAYEWLEKNGRK